MHRELGDERSRYGRKSLREQVRDVLAWPGEHRIATLVIVAFVAVALLLAAARGAIVQASDLRVGDCLYVPLDQTPDDARPIGEARDIGPAVLAGDAERAPCTASHGHEVSAILDLTAFAYPFADAQAACAAAFQPYVGRSAAGSSYATFAAVADSAEIAAGAKLGLCLVARADGGWMDHPARASGE